MPLLDREPFSEYPLTERVACDDHFPGAQGRSRVALLTLGCKINQYDTNCMVAQIKEDGYTIVSDAADADVIVVNTCTVTGRTDYKGRQAVRRAVQQNPEAVLVVTGCYAQTQPESLADIAGVDYVLGTAEKTRIASWISNCTKQKRPLIRTGGLDRALTLEHGPLQVHSGTTRAFLKIQDGCNHACTYCIIPRARGASRSLPEDLLWQKVRVLADNGFLEVILCGIHLGGYGLDLEPPTRLIQVLKRLEEDGPIPRVRISSIEPNELNDELIDLFGRGEHLCHHFHLPMQSGDTAILRAMNRPYTPMDFAERVIRTRTAMPDAAVGVDVIAGFPGESEAAFRRTVALLDSLPLSYFHVFPFSARPGTTASRLPDRVPPDVVQGRAEELRRMGREKRHRFHSEFLGREVEVLVESRRDPSTGMLKGVSRNYLPVLFNGPDYWQKKMLRVRIRSVNSKLTFGEVENSGERLTFASGQIELSPACARTDTRE